jgi:hypothetical protein
VHPVHHFLTWGQRARAHMTEGSIGKMVHMLHCYTGTDRGRGLTLFGSIAEITPTNPPPQRGPAFAPGGGGP